MNYPFNVKLEFSKCPNGCDDNDKIILTGRDRLHGLEGEFNVCKCLKCGLERTNPRPTANTIGAYYPDSYAPYQSDAVSIKKTRPVGAFKLFLRKLLGLDMRVLPLIKPGVMLEVGCSSGNYMSSVRDLGWIVEGVEFSDKAASVARTKGFDVKVGSLESVNLDEKKYDLIVGWMVIEHLHDPVQALKKLNTAIKDDGYLVASVPDTKSLAKFLFKEYCYDLHLPNHLYHFTPKTLKLILFKSGWILERVIWQRNCNTLINSFEYWAIDKNKKVLVKVASWLKLNPKASYLRFFLNILLGFTRQSGRIEIWARPVK